MRWRDMILLYGFGAALLLAGLATLALKAWRAL